MDQLFNDALAMMRKGCFAEACQALESLRTKNPFDAAVVHYLGLSYHEYGEWERGVEFLKQSVVLAPDNPTFHYNLAHAFEHHGCLDDIIRHYQKALELKPDYTEPRDNLSELYKRLGRLSDGENLCREGMRMRPECFHLNLACILTSMGRVDEALREFRTGLGFEPGSVNLFSNYLLSLNYQEGTSPKNVFEEHLRWHACFSARTELCRPKALRDRNHDRIRVGYVSGDFRQHSVCYFMEPVLYCHNADEFDVYCYSYVNAPDAVTERIRQLVPNWFNIGPMDDAQAAEQIVRDEIDILVDLAGHTSNRLGIFARRPAPVQISYLGYPNTTGLSAMDYRVTDAAADPVDQDKYYSERLLRMPDCFLCYAPPAIAPQVSGLPLEKNSQVTFASFNNMAKITPKVIQTWAQLLDAVPNSKLIVKNRAVADSEVQSRLRNQFEQERIDWDRIELVSFKSEVKNHLEIFNQVDIALDTFPYNGTTTTCESLWMGVPVVALEGSMHRSRVSSSLLRQVGLQELIAEDTTDYVEIAKQLTEKAEHLAYIRANLRDVMANSHLCNSKRFTGNLENLYRSCWKRCLRSVK